MEAAGVIDRGTAVSRRLLRSGDHRRPRVDRPSAVVTSAAEESVHAVDVVVASAPVGASAGMAQELRATNTRPALMSPFAARGNLLDW